MFKFSINNFRGFSNEEFDFSKINVLIGENSSGKSSVIKFFLALKQGLDLSSNKINFLFSGNYTNLGYYRDAISGHDDSKRMSFSFGFGEDYYNFFMDQMFGHLADDEVEDSELHYSSNSPDNNYDQLFVSRENCKRILDGFKKCRSSISIEFGKDIERQSNMSLKISNEGIGDLLISYSDINEDLLVFTNPECIMDFSDASSGVSYTFEGIEYDKETYLSIVYGHSLREQIRLAQIMPWKSAELYWKIAYLLVLQNYIKFFVNRINFVNPINSKAERFFIEKDQRDEESLFNLEAMVKSINKKDISNDDYQNFIEIIKDFGIVENLKITSARNMPVRQLRIKIKDVWSNIMDVGYGVALQLPVIFYAFLAEKNTKTGRVLFIEQPEVHLHPKLQAKFIETLLKLGNKNTYFIETHSEHIIRKLQVIVKEEINGVSSDSLRIYYMERMKNKTSKSLHKIESNGDLNPGIPSGFFDSSYFLMKQLLK